MAELQVRSHFRPEFINRIDEFTVFKALQRKDIKRIVILQARRVEERLQAKKMKMKLLEPAIEFLAVCMVVSVTSLLGLCLCRHCLLHTFIRLYQLAHQLLSKQPWVFGHMALPKL